MQRSDYAFEYGTIQGKSKELKSGNIIEGKYNVTRVLIKEKQRMENFPKYLESIK